MNQFLTYRFSDDPFGGNTIFKSNYLNQWCKRLSAAAVAKDYSTISAMTASMLSTDARENPIKLAIKIDYEYVILEIVRALQQVEGLDARRIAQLLILSSCPIRNVISQQSVEIVDHMIRLGSPVNDLPGDGAGAWSTSALHAAVAGGDSHLAAVELLLDRGADVQRPDSLGFTPLHRCLEARQCLGVLRLLMSRGARADSHDVARTSTLVTAVRNNQPLEVVQLLARDGADLTGRDANGCAPYHYAGRLGRLDVVDLLLDMGVDRNLRNSLGESILFPALRDSSLEFFRHLVLVCDVDLNLRTGSGGNLLHAACDWPAYVGISTKAMLALVAEKVRFCLLRGADLNARDARGATPLQLSLANHVKWLDALLEHVAVREYMDLPVDGRNSRLVYESDFCLSYLVACKIELVALMDLQFYNDVTLFNVLTDGEARMMGYVRNGDLVLAFQRIIAMQLFLIYSSALVERFNYFLDLHRMRERAAAVLADTLGSVLDYAGVQEIVKHLSNRDAFKLSRYAVE